MSLPPIKITFMIAIHCSSKPEENLGDRHWNSPEGIKTRQWLYENGLIDRIDFPAATDKGRAWVDLICSTPLPVHQWVSPERKKYPENYAFDTLSAKYDPKAGFGW